MKLTEKDKKYLGELGYSEKDFAQIEAATKFRGTTYEFNDEKAGWSQNITQTEAIRLLGRNRFLSGLSRSAFHWNAVRTLDDDGNKYIYFDSTNFFNL